MIVKNEADNIERALNSVLPWVDAVAILDTGSTDTTIADINQIALIHPHVKFTIRKGVFKDFAQARNDALELARESGCEYILIQDADMEFKVEDGEFANNLTEKAYHIQQEFGNISYYNTFLIRSDIAAKYIGVVHEYLETFCNPVQLHGVSFFNHGGGSRGLDPDKFKKDIKLLEGGLALEPLNTRYRFYLAQSYFDDGQYVEANRAYWDRINMDGWEEEIYYCYYRIALCLMFLGKPTECVISAFSRAHNYRPERMEAINALEQYCNRLRLSTALPKRDILFVEHVVYSPWI